MFLRTRFNAKFGGYTGYIIEDTDFSYKMNDMDTIEAIIIAYSECNLPVASNLARYYVWHTHKDKQRVDRVKSDAIYYNLAKPSLNYAKYKNCTINQVKKLEFIGK